MQSSILTPFAGQGWNLNRYLTIKNAAGIITGASKIARDITERKRAHEQQRVLLKEMNHRVENLFSLAGAVTTLSARSAATANDLAEVGSRKAGSARACS
jgi:hypothetical protein